MTRERAKELLPVLQAYVEGKQIQFRESKVTSNLISDWRNADSPNFFSEYNYRIKPEPKLRPWRPEEVPLGAWARNIQCPSRYLIVAFTTTDVYFGIGSAAFSFQECLDEKEYSTDGGKTWKPCGVEE